MRYGPPYVSPVQFKDGSTYLTGDRGNPELPWPDYGWPLGTECFYFGIEGYGYILFATGTTPERAARRRDEVLDCLWRGTYKR